jgi:hydrogenase maturation protein HypF
LQQTQQHLQSVLNILPDAFACDFHPDFYSRQLAQTLAHETNKPLIPVQHHHAHAASVMAEHGLEGPVLAVIFDGFGLSETGELWGGELLHLPEVSQCHRVSSFAPLTLPGGDKASEEGWRIGAAFLHRQGRWQVAERRYGKFPLAVLKQMLDKNLNCPTTSSAGRLFDCAASLLNISHRNGFESQSAMSLQAIAEQFIEDMPQEISSIAIHEYFHINESGQLDFSGLLNALPDLQPGFGAALFHRVLVEAIVNWVQNAAAEVGVHTVVLSGGVWLNRLLLDSVLDAFESTDLQVLTNRQTPMNDGNISLGQLWVAIHQLKNTTH